MRWLIFSLLSGPVAAAACPPVPDIAPAMDALIEQAHAADTISEGQEVGREMWKIWADAPDEAAQAILDRGMGKRRVFDLLGALVDFDELVQYCPDYAEGYNQRAFVHYLQEDYPAAILDLDEALARSPRHVGALSGKALALLRLGRTREARLVLTQALSINPWIPERSLVVPGAPLAPVGEEL